MADSRDTEIEWIKKGLDKLDTKFDKGFADMQTSIKDIRELYLDTFETKEDARIQYKRFESELNSKADQEDVTSLKQIVSWAGRIVFGAIITGLLGLLFVNGGLYF